jgi:hypothetical protein
MFDDADELMTAVRENGELMVVLESDREYELHTHDTEKASDEFVRTEGMRDGEYVVVQFNATDVEHYYIHREC